MTKRDGLQSSTDDDQDHTTYWWILNLMRKSNKAPSSGNAGRMQRIVSQAGLYAAAARLSLDSGGADDEGEAVDENSGLLKYKLSGSLNAICISPDNEFVAAAGREVLKILTVNRAEVREVLNLRAGSHVNINYSCNDVKWGNNITKGKIATAATNGSIILWDVNKLTGKRAERIINEHSRAVNRVCFQPENGHILLSASQDGTMKCWDLRDPKNGAKIKYEGKSESVRDVQFNPVTYHEFAAAFETGTIQKWDMRNPKAIYDRKVSAHNGPCLTLDWHSNGRVIASGGRDKTIKLWDLSVDSRRPLATVRTMAAVGRVQWRPGYEYEIASCALLNDNRINVWDIRRPHIAEYTFEHHEATPSGFLWLNPDVLYSCSKDKMFIRQEIKTAYEPVKVLRRNGMGWNIQGDLAFAIDFSSRDQFVDESTIPRPAASQTKKWKKLSKRWVEDEVTQYVPPSKCMIGHLPLFDFEAFSVFAEHYEISSDNVLNSCQNNAEVAWNMGSYRTSQTWTMVALFFSDEENVVENMLQNNDNDVNNIIDIANTEQQQQQLPRIKTDIATTAKEQTNTDYEDNDNESSRSTVSSHSSARRSSITSESCIRDPERADLWPEWQYQDQIMGLLDYYTEQGDVQMCVTLYLVLSNYITVDENRLEDWFAAYIDLLHRFKLWTTATAIINACPVARIREMNENATTINVACNNCFKLVSGSSRGAWACDKCHKLLNPCSLCHQTVRGLYAWCQGCNHGGHLEHLRDWFSNHTLCPTGCGHSCTLITTP